MQVSSPSSSDSESTSSKHNTTAADAKDVSASESAASPDGEENSSEPVFTKRAVNPEQAFQDFYLRQATKEFANDLDKLRSAGDFNAFSVPLLVDALKQGTACFGKDERVRVGGAALSDV